MKRRGHGFRLTCAILCLISAILPAYLILADGEIDDLLVFVYYVGPAILSICLIVFNTLSKSKKLYNHLYLVALLLLLVIITRTGLWVYFILGFIGIIFGFIGYFKGLKK